MQLDRFLRYYPVIKILEKDRSIKKILDVGSGDLGLGEFYNEEFYGLDKNISDKACPRMIKVKTSAVKIPFSDNYFDCVISLDLLEHLKPIERTRVINEIQRVARKIAVIGFPCGDKSLLTDKKIYTFYKKNKIEIPGWLKEHINSDYPILENISNKIKINKIIRKNENLFLHSLIMKIQINSTVCKLFDYLLRKFRPLMNIFVELTNFGECYRQIIFINKNE